MKQIDTETIQKIIAWLENVKTRPQKFFGAIEPESVENGLYWFQMAFVNLDYNFPPSKGFAAKRGLGENTMKLSEQLKKRDLSDAEIVEEILDIEINFWKQFLVERIESYRNFVEKVIGEYAAIPYSHGEIEQRVYFDREKDVYMLYVVGWDDGKRIHSINIHADIISGKIWIQHDNTEEGIATDLEQADVPKSDIVLAFHAPELRKYTEYAVA